MSGHSKWKNIMHKKEKTDAQRAKVFTKIGKEISIAVKAGGPDPASNPKLKDLIAKAKSNNVPNDNIERVIKKAASGDTENYEELSYEGYGPSGIAVIVEATTDNRNRTGADLRHYFDKFGGNLGTTGCVSFMFEDKGVIVIEANAKATEDAVMEAALNAGAMDFVAEEGAFEIYTDPADVSAVRDELAAQGFEAVSAEVEKVPSTYVTLTNEDDIVKMNRLLEMLEDNEDVINVWHNWENCDE
ncbi:MAG: YebC/PmpR family DNA-binding transcriptional regulator [Clostridia bacterium]|nr:YebC/PmpR family DNA-binding transcriptional regulator [Clostridia bacterium]